MTLTEALAEIEALHRVIKLQAATIRDFSAGQDEFDDLVAKMRAGRQETEQMARDLAQRLAEMERQLGVGGAAAPH